MSWLGSKKKAQALVKPSRRDIQKAMMVIGCGMMAISEDDRSGAVTRIKTGAGRMPLFGNNTTEEDEDILSEAAEVFDANPQQSVENAAGILVQTGWHAAAFCYACDIMLADGEIEDNEFVLLGEYAQYLRIKENEAEAMRMTFRTYYQAYEG